MNKLIKTLALLVGLFQLSVAAQAAELKFGGPIDSSQSGTPSTAVGSAILTLDTDTNTFDISINISGLINDLTASHIHVGAPGESGGVIVDIGDMSVYDVIGDFYIYQANGISFPAANLVDLLAGKTYVNFHTTEYPSGEVRGQLPQIEDNNDSLVALSTRGLVNPGNGKASLLIGGLVLEEPKTILFRTVGETLGEAGVANTLPDPIFQVYKLDIGTGTNSVIGENDNWKEGGQQYKIAATGFAPHFDSESALLMTLDPGLYTINADAVQGAGIALVETYGINANGVGSTIASAAKPGPSQTFTILNAALQATGLDAVLDGPGPFTLFAPNDAAFLASFSQADLAELLADDADKAEDLQTLTGILMYHVIGNNIPSSALAQGLNTVSALSGLDFNVTVGPGGVTAQNGNVIETDIISSNGVIHVVDAVLAPFGIASELSSGAQSGSYKILSAALAAVGFDSVLDGEGPFTLFAPSDAVFLAAFTQEELDELLADDADRADDLATLATILSYHVIDSKILSTDLMEGTVSVPALTGIGLNVTLDSGMVSVQGANVTQADLVTPNGVIHFVDQILMPYGIGTTISDGGTTQSFTILNAALEATGLDAALDGAGLFTLFAPTDAAFLAIFSEAELNELLADDADKADDLANLAAILSYHVIGSEIRSTDLAEGVNTAPALTGVNLYVTLDSGTVTVQDATVIEPDVLAANGVIHVVNAVLSPSGVGSTITTNGLTESFSILGAALSATGLDAALDGAGPFTLFAPTDAAFLAAFTQAELDELLADDADKVDDLAALSAILLYHVVGLEILSTGLSEGVTTVQALTTEDLSVTVAGGNVTAQNANVTEFDILASNGVIHVVDAVLEP